MKRFALWLSLSVVPFSDISAAYQTFTVRNRVPIIVMNDYGQPGDRHYDVRKSSYLFRVEVLNDSEDIKPETFLRGRPFIAAEKDERFAVRLYNPLPVRVAVNLTVDGLNSITGKPSGIADGEKWLIEANSFITIRGWQVNQGEARRFFFTEKPKSYAKWSGDRRGEDLSMNCGVIGAAYFWSQKELDRYNEEHPDYRYTWTYKKSAPFYAKATGVLAARSAASEFALQDSVSAAQAASPMEQLAGTGMGERESNPTTLVDFPYDTGMYQLAQAVIIYYDFIHPEPPPNPFPNIHYAPEME